MESKSICAIKSDVVHKICSGQVIVTLAVATKELVENAIDAGATNIQIRLKEYGSELIEVSDNGYGVKECNFEALALKHYTSKLSKFSDLSFISTLGFRGEALSSLCALSNLTITTRHESTDLGTKILFDQNGHIKSKEICSRQVGTTVSLVNLFYTLPVRQKDFLKNVKREFTKMCNLLYAYCAVAEGVGITCINENKNGIRTTIVSTQGCNSIKQNIACIFGLKQLDSLIPLKVVNPDENVLEEFSLKKLPGEQLPFTFEGYISKCSRGNGRSSNDRQYYYINSRPCEPIRIMKLVNKVYKSFNPNQYPFVFLNITIEQDKIDINVTPDKRQIFIEKEKLLMATLKSSLLDVFNKLASTLDCQNVELKKKFQTTFSQNINTSVSKGVKRNISPPKISVLKLFEKKKKLDSDFEPNLSDESSSSPILNKNDSVIKNEYVECKYTRNEKNKENVIENNYNLNDEVTNSNIEHEVSNVTNDLQKNNVYEDYQENINEEDQIKVIKNIVKENCKEYVNEKEKQLTETCDNFKLMPHEKYLENINKTKKEQHLDLENKIKNLISERKEAQNKIEEICSKRKILLDNMDHDETIIEPAYSLLSAQNTVVKTSIDSIKILMNRKKDEEAKATVVKFRSEITNPNAEKELEKEITKDMFKKMSIIGQFNKGFIITKLNSDLFIIDQHATDEKYNFEMLQKTTILEKQKLIVPKLLELTVSNESLLLEHIDIFKKNGFTFEIDEKGTPGRRVCLTAIPVSKNYQFGKDDIDEMLFLLQEDSSNSNSCRPTRVRAMFASRACRKSVMIGNELSSKDMRRLVDHMGEIEQPWNCPHGRPTMRHLVNLDLLQE